MRTLGVIPARWGSSRLPGKVLKEIGGKPLIQLVYEGASGARRLDELVVATDDERVKRAVEVFGGRAVITSPAHRSGSDRIAEVAAKTACDIVVNVQGDEPMIRGDMIDALIGVLGDEASLDVATVATPLPGGAAADDPHVVKVVRDLEGNALYFSRAPIPYARDSRGREGILKHIGLYAYRRDFLARFTAWPQTPLEKIEKLEQLRILEHGVRIRVVETPHDSVSVDTAEDLARVRKILEAVER